jgi:hypothetical protein
MNFFAGWSKASALSTGAMHRRAKDNRNAKRMADSGWRIADSSELQTLRQFRF